VALILSAGKLIRERRPVAQRFMNAHLKGRDYIVKIC
jgi:hypothetical protein